MERAKPTRMPRWRWLRLTKQAERSSTNPLELDATEDDPEALEVLLRFIHFSLKPVPTDPSVDLQLSIAILLDKYDCLHVLYDHSHRWLADLASKPYTTISVWKMARIAYVMHNPTVLAKMTTILAQWSTLNDLQAINRGSWEFPDGLRGLLLNARSKSVDAMILEIEKCMSELRRDTRRFSRSRKWCLRCGSEKPPQTKSCGRCSDTDITILYCDAGTRLDYFVGCLEAGHVWPLSRQHEISPAKLKTTVQAQVPSTHDCELRRECPVVVKCGILKDRLAVILGENSKVDFKPARFETDIWDPKSLTGQKRKIEDAA